MLQFPTHGHPLDRVVYDLHAKLWHIAFAITTANFEDKNQKLSSHNGVGSVQLNYDNQYSDAYQILSSIFFYITYPAKISFHL